MGIPACYGQRLSCRTYHPPHKPKPLFPVQLRPILVTSVDCYLLFIEINLIVVSFTEETERGKEGPRYGPDSQGQHGMEIVLFSQASLLDAHICNVG